jgi:hypothetical protein
MSLSALNLNKKLYALSEDTPSQETYYSKLGYQIPQYVKSVENQRHKRFILAPKGDPVQKMDQVVRDHEVGIMEDLKKNYLES